MEPLFLVYFNCKAIKGYKSAKCAYKNAFSLAEGHPSPHDMVEVRDKDGLYYDFKCRAGRRGFIDKHNIKDVELYINR